MDAAATDAGLTNAIFMVRLSAPTITSVVVGFQTVDGTARHGNDFEAAAGTLVIPAGRTSGQIAVAVKGDIVPEGNEVFFLRLTGAANATIADPVAQATIVDRHDAPRAAGRVRPSATGKPGPGCLSDSRAREAPPDCFLRGGGRAREADTLPDAVGAGA